MSIFVSSRRRSLVLALAIALPAVASAQVAPLKSATYWNPAESGWGIAVTDQGNALAVGWYTYDLDGEPTWMLATTTPQSDGSYVGDIVRHTGVPFAQISGQAADPATTVGRATLRFSGNDVTFDTLIGGTTRSKSLTRFAFGTNDIVCRATTGSRTGATNYSDLWWNPQSSGWGVHMSHVGTSLFATWYTYDTDREPIFYVASTTRQADGSYAGTVTRSRNGTPYPQINGAPASSGSDQVGTATLTFANGENATFAYSIGGTQQTKTLTRLQFGSTASTCTVEPYVDDEPVSGQGEDCFPPVQLNDRRTERVTQVQNGQTTAASYDRLVARTGTFEGQAALVEEKRITGGAIQGRNYYAPNETERQVVFGADGVDPAGNVVATSVNEPLRIALSRRFTIGQTERNQWRVRSTSAAGVTMLDLTASFKLIGREQVTVPGGTFNACKFEYNSTVSSTIAGFSTRVTDTGTAWSTGQFGEVKRVVTRNSEIPVVGTQTLQETIELMSATVGGRSTP